MASKDQPRVRPSDLVVEGGVAQNAAALIDAIYNSRDPQLEKAIMLRHHRLVHTHDDEETPQLSLSQVAKRAGLDEVKDAQIHGGDLEKAWVVYVAEDHLGSNYYGAFPYDELEGSGAAKGHVSEAEAFEKSAAGQQLVKQRESREKDEPADVKTSRKPAPPRSSGDDE